TSAGRAMLWRLPALAAALAALGLCDRQDRWERGRWVWLPAAAGLLATTPLTGHAVTSPTPLLSMTADWLHLAAAVVWGGSLAGWWRMSWRGEDRGEEPGRLAVFAEALSRLSTLGLVAVTVLVGSG